VLLEYELRFAGVRTERILAKVRRDSRFGPYHPHEVTLAPELLKREFEELSRANRYFQARADGLRVVRPFDYFEELNTVLIEKASGADLGVLARTDQAGALAAFARCGQWLRAFHDEVHDARNRPWTVGKFEQRLTKRREKLVALGVPSDQLDPLLYQVLGASHACQERGVPQSLLHGDYKLRHVWASPGSIQVFDFGNVHVGDCYVDVASFLVELGVLRLGSPWFDAQRVSRYCEAFLSGYFPGGPPPVLNLYVVDGLLKKWIRRLRMWSRTAVVARLHTYARRVGANALVDRWYLDRWFAARVRESLETLGRAA
jgi:hypothetical protein